MNTLVYLIPWVYDSLNSNQHFFVLARVSIASCWQSSGRMRSFSAPGFDFL